MYGRRVIYTDVAEVTRENIISVLQKAMPKFSINRDRCEFLLNYEEGNQPLGREKTYRTDIDNNLIDNVANQITEFWCGFQWGNPITLIQRGTKDSGTSKESEAINLLNECYESEHIRRKTQELARFVEITGIGFTYVDLKDRWVEGDSYFSIDVLDPRCTFVIRSSRYVDKRPMVGVTFRTDDLGNRYFTCFTDRQRFEIVNLCKIIDEKGKEKNVDEWNHGDRSSEKNPFNLIPVIEWERSPDRMGVFERQIPALDCLNILESDFVNDVDQNTNCVWFTTDIEFATDESGNEIKPQDGDWLQAFSSRDGKTPTVKPLTVPYDYNGILSNVVTQRTLILQKCNVPQRNNDSGGSTGVAADSNNGWAAAESAACKEQNIIEGCKMDEVKVVLQILKKSPHIPQDSPLLELKAMDIQPSIKREKSYELTAKINAFATGVSHGLDYKSMIKVINLFDDPQQVIDDSEETMEMYIESTFGNGETEPEGAMDEQTPNNERLGQDFSDQTENSPNTRV